MQRHYLISLILILATVAVFHQVRNYDFVSNWDDQSHVYNNPYLNPVTPRSVMYFWQHQYLGMYRPLTFTTWAAIATIARFPQPRQSPVLGNYDLNPGAFHIANLILHVLSTLVAFALLGLLLNNTWAAGAGALLFGIHPIQVESVAFVSGLQNVLVGFFSLLAIWQYFKYARLQQEQVNRKKQIVHYIIATVCFILALLAKPSAVSVPFIVLGVDYWILRRPIRQSGLALLPWAIMILPAMLSTQQVSLISNIPVWKRLFIAGDALAFYVYKFVLPLNLGVDYGRTPQHVLNHWWGYLTWLVPGIAAVLIWQYRTRYRFLVSAAITVVAILLPVLGLVPFKFQLFSTAADRYFYLATLGPSLVLAFVLKSVWEARAKPRQYSSLLTGGCAVLLLLLGWRSTLQVRNWQNSDTLFENSIRVNPQGWYAYFSLGLIRYREGRTDEAITRFRETLQLVPNSLPVHTFTGLALLKQGQIEPAINHLSEALRIGPRFPLAHFLMGCALDRQGESEEAVGRFRQALQAIPDSPELYSNLGVALSRQGDYRNAIYAFRKARQLRRSAVELDAANAQVNNEVDIGDITRQQRYSQEIIKEALAINPHHASALKSCGTFLLKQNNNAEAALFFREAL